MFFAAIVERLTLTSTHYQVGGETNNIMVMQHQMDDLVLTDRQRLNWPSHVSSLSHLIMSHYSKTQLCYLKFAVKHRLGIFRDLTRIWVPIPPMKMHDSPSK